MIEKKTADTLLQRPVAVVIAGREYQAPPVTLATMVMVSQAIAEMGLGVPDPGESPLTHALRRAKDAAPVASILAILVLGAKAIERPPRLRWPWASPRRRLARLERDIALTMTPRQINEALALLLGAMETKDFFGITTFLAGISVTKATKVESRTASGQT